MSKAGYHKVFQVRKGILHYCEATVECYLLLGAEQEVVFNKLGHLEEGFKLAAAKGIEKALSEIETELSVQINQIGFTYCDTTDDDVFEATYEATLKAAEAFLGQS